MTATEQVDGGLVTGAHEQRERAEQLILRQRRGVAVAGGDQRGGKVVPRPLARFRDQGCDRAFLIVGLLLLAAAALAGMRAAPARG
jgi:hypothetical protein